MEERPIITLTLTEKTNEVYVKFAVKDTDVTAETEKQTFDCYYPVYTVENVSFTGVQSEDGASVTVTPSAVVKLDGTELAKDKYQYTIYLNGEVYTTNTFATVSTSVALVNGIVNEIYVVVAPVDDTNIKGTSMTQEFAYGVEIEKVDVTLKFKSSSSARYVPKLTVDGVVTTMTKEGKAIAKNASQTQSYYWYTATIEVPVDTATKILFSNAYSMSASASITASEDTIYYFGVDNLNDGSVVVDLSNAEEYIRNFVKSATHMVYNNAYDSGVATTSINGSIYKMGDADGDNEISVLDATTIQRALAKKIDLSETSKDLADYNLDSANSITDATSVQIYLVNGR